MVGKALGVERPSAVPAVIDLNGAYLPKATSMDAFLEGILSLLDDDENSIDVIVTDLKDKGKVMVLGEAFAASRNATGNALMKHFVFLDKGADWHTLGHEIMRVLLDSAHRSFVNRDPITALFREGVADKPTKVGASKRLGPFKGDGPGTNDKATIRGHAEDLP